MRDMQKGGYIGLLSNFAFNISLYAMPWLTATFRVIRSKTRYWGVRAVNFKNSHESLCIHSLFFIQSKSIFVIGFVPFNQLVLEESLQLKSLLGEVEVCPVVVQDGYWKGIGSLIVHVEANGLDVEHLVLQQSAIEAEGFGLVMVVLGSIPHAVEYVIHHVHIPYPSLPVLGIQFEVEYGKLVAFRRRLKHA
jgi:hypothetical protein